VADNQYYLPTERDKQILERFLAREAQRLENEIHGLGSTDPDIQTPDIYVAVPPCGQGIPARVGDTPGMNECCIYSVNKTALLDDDINAAVLTPVLMPNGDILRRWVYNIYERAVGTGVFYIRILRDKYGLWLNEYPNEGSTAAYGGTTQTTPIPPIQQPIGGCQGTCRWIWHEVDQYWELDVDSCRELPTSTSSTTSTTSNPMLTTTPSLEQCELCPTTPPPPTTSSTTSTTTSSTTSTSTSSTTSSSTTTTTPRPDACNKCSYPTYCGTFEGECTYTPCVKGDVQPTVTCTSTTTLPPTTLPATTCDCNTTTTAPPDPSCVDGCDWIWWPGDSWHLISNGCNTFECPCSPPDTFPSECSGTSTPCVKISDPQPPAPPSCLGDCTWWWMPSLGAYVIAEFECNFISVFGCSCVPPSEPGGSTCRPYNTPCQSPPTTPPPESPPVTPGTCEACYTSSTTSTTTTTTTPPPCSEGCLHGWNGSIWVLLEDNCFPDCLCQSPAIDGHDTCETAVSPCQNEPPTTPPPTTPTTSTTTTATTTTTPCPIGSVSAGDNEVCYMNTNPDPSGAPNWSVADYDVDCGTCIPSPGFDTCLDELNAISNPSGCDVVCFPCETGPTTTTTATTPCPCVFNDDGGGDWTTDCDGASCPPGQKCCEPPFPAPVGAFHTPGSCVPFEAPCSSACGGNCDYQCILGGDVFVWMNLGNDCDAGCGCTGDPTSFGFNCGGSNIGAHVTLPCYGFGGFSVSEVATTLPPYLKTTPLPRSLSYNFPTTEGN
jgi:hypothetical protein